MKSVAGALGVVLLTCALPGLGNGKAHVQALFSPADDIVGTITGRVAAARESVRVQAYLLTDRRIATALATAGRRGVAVEVIGDAAQHAAGGMPHARLMERAGVRVYLNAAYAAAHDKVLIIDGETDRAQVITGSYNFTVAAQSRNAENVVVISGNRAVTDRFVANFRTQLALSTPWPSPSPQRR